MDRKASFAEPVNAVFATFVIILIILVFFVLFWLHNNERTYKFNQRMGTIDGNIILYTYLRHTPATPFPERQTMTEILQRFDFEGTGISANKDETIRGLMDAVIKQPTNAFLNEYHDDSGCSLNIRVSYKTKAVTANLGTPSKKPCDGEKAKRIRGIAYLPRQDSGLVTVELSGEDFP